MAELIIPPALRARHREGFSRLLVTGQPNGRPPSELTGMRSDGSEFPVELTITRIDLPGPPMFTGYLRDISDRKQTEADLRASRARIVEAADDARRRLERDLHDGAQPRLVNLGLGLRLRAPGGEDPEAAALLDEAMRNSCRRPRSCASSRGGSTRPTHRGRAGARADGWPLAPSCDPPSYARRRCPSASRRRLLPRGGGADQRGALLRRPQRWRCTSTGRVLVEVHDNGRGGAEPTRGSGLRGLADRLAALDGFLRSSARATRDHRPGPIPCA